MSECVHLIIQYYNDTMPERAAEYNECMRRNLANPYIKAVHNLVEAGTIVPDEFKRHPKYRQQTVPRWLTYADAFSYANANLAGETVCICNLDIFLDPTIHWDDAGARTVGDNVVLCLSRIEFDIDGGTFKDPGLDRWAFANSQDAWIFAAPFEVPNSDFEIGTLGCDNAIAHRIKMAGRVPINAGGRFRIYHYDRARGKSFANHLKLQKAEGARRPKRQPDLEGQYLLPDFDKIKSVDRLLYSLNVTELDRYVVICDVLNRFFKIRNE